MVDHLGSRHRLEYIHKIIERGTGADRQLAVYEEQKNLESVTNFIQSQFLSEIT